MKEKNGFTASCHDSANRGMILCKNNVLLLLSKSLR